MELLSNFSLMPPSQRAISNSKPHISLWKWNLPRVKELLRSSMRGAVNPAPRNLRKQVWAIDCEMSSILLLAPYPCPLSCDSLQLEKFTSSLLELLAVGLVACFGLWLAFTAAEWQCVSSEIRPKRPSWTRQPWLTCQLTTDTWGGLLSIAWTSTTAQLSRNPWEIINSDCLVSLHFKAMCYTAMATQFPPPPTASPL